ncbi:DNA-binding transcriptional regulator, HxlR family [Pedococcus dokdonensis]|uniref:DNA-binding transcriptional regulator, HxlR family n=1 Tax=Pedococcus dokdonensis TaxID=443156 RepID=A0A1H0QLF9_9MICO|nr:helix-turn-helix domain-containing protein [Pedococcus dokdonensis]SDP18157.1 DNA-binding transcriptional regulator, HxlR family [Pedococcus dokdonensis]
MTEQSRAPEQWPPGHCLGLQQALELIGGRWTGSILLAVLSGARRFSDIRVAVPGVSDRLLCDRLRRLEAEGLLERHTATDPGLVGYAPTVAGQALVPALRALSDWTTRWRTDIARESDTGAHG